MKKAAFLLLALCLLFGCGKEKLQMETVSCVSAEDCFLCGRTEEDPWGQDNVGLVSLNTFAIMPVGINRYDRTKTRIEQPLGTLHMQSFQGGEDGFRVSGLEDPDLGCAMLTVVLGEDAAADRRAAAAFLCQDCL